MLVDTDYAVPGEVDRIRAQVAKLVPTPTGARQTHTWEHVFEVSNDPTRAPGTHALPATFGILPEAGDLETEIVVQLDALPPGSETPLVTRRVRTGFVQGEVRLVRMLLYQACAQLSCPGAEVCGCQDGVACAVPSCVDEWLAPNRLEPMDDPGALPVDSEFPVPADLPDASVPDASVPDASVPDASVPDASVPDASVPDASLPDGGVLECEAPLELCDTDCVDTRSDASHCGNCETVCPAQHVCEGSTCVDLTDCRTNGLGCSGFTYCDEETGDCLRGCITDTQCEGDHERCDAVTHECVCTTDFERCLFDCVDTQVDPRFCGDCRTSCPSGDLCELGICIDPGDCRTNELGCSGFTYCDPATGDCLFGCAVDTQCAAPEETCDLTLHECVCSPGFHRCGSVCASDSAVETCGASCTPCPIPPNSTPICDLGNCDFLCADGYVRCGDACCPTSCPPGQALYAGACAPLHVQLVSDQGNIGEYLSLALDGSGAAHISCYTRSGKNLKYGGQQPDGTWITETADAPDDVGQHTSIAVDDSGAIHIAYYDATAGSLNHAVRLGPESWSTEVVADGGDVGKHASLAFDATGLGHIAYYDQSNGNLMLASEQPGGGWSAQTVDAVDDVGEHASLAFDPDGAAHIAYYDRTNGNLMLAVQQGLDAWSVQTIDAIDDVGAHASLAFDPTGTAHIAYYDRTNGSVMLASEGDAGAWNRQTVDTANDVGSYASLAFDANGVAHVSYYDATAGDLKHAMLARGTGWAIEMVDGVGDVGEYSSLRVDAEGNTHIGYYDRTNTNVKYALIAAPP